MACSLRLTDVGGAQVLIPSPRDLNQEDAAAGLTRDGSSGSGVRGEPSGDEGQLLSLALVTSPSARASNEGNPSSSTGMLSRVSVSTASKLASFSSSIFLGGGGGGGEGKGEKNKRNGKIGHFSQTEGACHLLGGSEGGGCRMFSAPTEISRVFFFFFVPRRRLDSVLSNRLPARASRACHSDFKYTA